MELTKTIGAGCVVLVPGKLEFLSSSKVYNFTLTEEQLRHGSLIAELFAAYHCLKLMKANEKFHLYTDCEDLINFLASKKNGFTQIHETDDIKHMILTIKELRDSGRILSVTRVNDRSRGTQLQIDLMSEAHELSAEASGSLKKIKATGRRRKYQPPPPKQHGSTDGGLDIDDLYTEPEANPDSNLIEGWGPGSIDHE